MSKDLLVRAISAFILLAFAVGLYVFGGTSALLYLGLAILLIGAWEYTNLFFKNEPLLKIFFLLLTAVSVPLFYFHSVAPLIYSSLFLICFGVLYLKRNSKSVDELFKIISLFFIGYFYTVVCPFFLFKILSIENNGIKLFFSALLITFSCDVFAYAFGRAFGKSLIFPLASPKKTVAGAVGGLSASILFSVITLVYIFNLTGLVNALVLGALCGLATQSGDFFESLLKRVAKVKDSGKIMPGHGGILDRFDGLYFSGPVFYTFIYFLNI